MRERPELVMTREFNAAVDLVWSAWTVPTLVSRWYGPGVETIIHEFDLRPGGTWRNEMKMRNGSMFTRMDFIEVVKEKKITYHHVSVDENWHAAVNPAMPDWPLKFLTIIDFETRADKTMVQLRQTPVDASEAEIACFGAMISGMNQGWGAGFDLMAGILIELQQ